MPTTAGIEMKSAVIQFQDHGEPLYIADVAAFLALLSWVHMHAHPLVENWDISELMENSSYRNFLPTLGKRLAARVDEKFDFTQEPDRLGDDSLKVLSMQMHSPLEIVVAGCLPPLVLALVLSGGEVSYSQKNGLKVKLPPVGSGIKKLKDAIISRKRSESDDEND